MVCGNGYPLSASRHKRTSGSFEAFRTLFAQLSFPEGWTTETVGGIFDRQRHRYIVFDVDATRQAARQRAFPCDSALPPAKRRLDAVCAPGYKGRKRDEVVRARTTALQMHTRQWVGTSAGRRIGNVLEFLCTLEASSHSQELSLRAAILITNGIIGKLSKAVIAGLVFPIRDRDIGSNVGVFQRFDDLKRPIRRIACRLFRSHLPPKIRIPE